jgi:hypothetical protein
MSTTETTNTTECFICKNKGWYRDFAGIYHRCPRCNAGQVTWTWPPNTYIWPEGPTYPSYTPYTDTGTWQTYCSVTGGTKQ